jgi:hypothetical protein
MPRSSNDRETTPDQQTSIVITRRIKPGAEAAYELLVKSLLDETRASHPGFLRAQVVPPGDSDVPYHITSVATKLATSRFADLRRILGAGATPSPACTQTRTDNVRELIQ